jgi:hypothetical protein
MSARYPKVVSENFRNARGGHDKLNAIQNVVEACDHVRKEESRGDARKRGRSERTRRMWLKNQVNWTEKEAQKWESMALERCVMGMDYEMRLVPLGIYGWEAVAVRQGTVRQLVRLGACHAGGSR